LWVALYIAGWTLFFVFLEDHPCPSSVVMEGSRCPSGEDFYRYEYILSGSALLVASPPLLLGLIVLDMSGFTCELFKEEEVKNEPLLSKEELPL